MFLSTLLINDCIPTFECSSRKFLARSIEV